jgi:hypothetical protein
VLVTEHEWGVIAFEVKFAHSPPLYDTGAWADKLSVELTAIGKSTRRYDLTLSMLAPRREVLRRLPAGKTVILELPVYRTTARSVTLTVKLHAIGDPSIVRYRVEAARELRGSGTPISTDWAPNKGQMVWRAAP